MCEKTHTNQCPVGMHWQAPCQYPPVWFGPMKWRLLWRKSIWKSATFKSGRIISAPQTLENLTVRIELLQSSYMRACRFLTSIELHFCRHLQISEDLKCWGASDITCGQRHHTIEGLKERGVEWRRARWSSLKQRERAIINQTNTGTVSNATLG